MHATTEAVRALYERFPYPAGPASLRLGFDVRRSLSFVEHSRPEGRPLTVLDAGCGRGAGLIGMATAQPGINFVGVDLNRVALAEVRQQARKRGLNNVELAEVDLETLAGLPVPEGGYDLIVSSGVIHHLVDPAAGLEGLAAALAPWGVLDLMVYAKPGRIGIETVHGVLARTIPADLPLDQRLAAARRLVASLPEAPFREAAGVDDVEFVDRYLHPQYVSYSLDDLRSLTDEAGLSLVRWTDPGSVDSTRGGAAGWQEAARRSPETRPRTWDLLLARSATPLREPCRVREVDQTTWALNPEGVLDRGVRTFWTGARPTPLSWRHPRRPAIPFADGPAAAAAPFLHTVGGPFLGRTLLAHLAGHGVPLNQGRELLLTLERLDVLWRPHRVELVSRRLAA